MTSSLDYSRNPLHRVYTRIFCKFDLKFFVCLYIIYMCKGEEICGSAILYIYSWFEKRESFPSKYPLFAAP